MYAAVSDGVVRVETTACAGGGVGSGFLIGPDLVATVAHVVDAARSVVIKSDHGSTTGTVIGIDPRREVALVRTSEPLTGHVFTLAGTDPAVGDDVAAIGFPLAGQKSLTRGSVSGLERDIDVDSTHLTGLIQTDTAVNPGNSGGPLLDASERVVGLVDAKRDDADSIAYAVPAATADSLLAGWRWTPVPVRDAVGCQAPTGPENILTDVSDDSGHPDGPAVQDTFQVYGTGINTGDYAAAYARLSPASQSRTSIEKFTAGTRSSYLFGIRIERISRLAGSTDSALVSFTTVQDAAAGRHGQTCSLWRMTYRLIDTPSGYLIDRATSLAGSPGPC